MNIIEHALRMEYQRFDTRIRICETEKVSEFTPDYYSAPETIKKLRAAQRNLVKEAEKAGYPNLDKPPEHPWVEWNTSFEEEPAPPVTTDAPEVEDVFESVSPARPAPAVTEEPENWKSAKWLNDKTAQSVEPNPSDIDKLFEKIKEAGGAVNVADDGTFPMVTSKKWLDRLVEYQTRLSLDGTPIEAAPESKSEEQNQSPDWKWGSGPPPSSETPEERGQRALFDLKYNWWTQAPKPSYREWLKSLEGTPIESTSEPEKEYFKHDAERFIEVSRKAAKENLSKIIKTTTQQEIDVQELFDQALTEQGLKRQGQASFSESAYLDKLFRMEHDNLKEELANLQTVLKREANRLTAANLKDQACRMLDEKSLEKNIADLEQFVLQTRGLDLRGDTATQEVQP